MCTNIKGVFMKQLLLTSFFCLMTISSSSFAKQSIPTVKEGAPLPSNLFVELNKAVNPAVVNISTEIKPKMNRFKSFQSGDPMEQLFRQFFNNQGGNFDRRQQKPAQSLGTGFIIRKDGLILTNSHVVDRADIINVQLAEGDEKTYPAKVIGKDPKTDVALIKIDTGRDLPTVALGSSSKVQVGEWVAAFGNPFGHGHSMSKGIISALGRDLDEINLFPFIQTDASINPGNSGGPLVNVKGEVIGVNTAIDARAQGIGFAIPIDEVKTIISQLEETGSVSRGFLGVEMRNMNKEIAKSLGTKQKDGALVVNVVPGSAAHNAGVKPYDIITKLGAKKIKTPGDLAKYVSRMPIGKTTSLYVARGTGKIKKLKVRMGNSNAPASSSRRNLKKPLARENADATFNTFGFSVGDITKKVKLRYELSPSGKHKAYVSRVLGYSKASAAGLREGDVVYEINTKPVFSSKDAKRLLSKKSESFLIRIKRGSTFSLLRLEK